MGNVVLVSGSRFTALETQFPTNHSIISTQTSFSHTPSFTKTLSHGLLEKSEWVANSPWLTLSKEKRKALISWDTSWHSLDYRSSVTSAGYRDHRKVRSHHSSLIIMLQPNHRLQITGASDPNPSEHSYLFSPSQPQLLTCLSPL